MHILLVRFSSMGDVVLQTATLNWLKANFGENVKLSFLTSREFSSLVENHPTVFRTLSFDRRGGETWSDLVTKVDHLDREEPIDLILDLHGTLRSWRLRLSFWSIPSLSVDKRRWERFFLTKIPSKYLKRIFNLKLFGLEPQVERILKDLESLFLDTRAIRRTRDFRFGPHQELTSLSSLKDFDLPKPYIVLAPSASFAPKRWPVLSFVQLAREFLRETTYHVVVLAGPQDDFCEAFSGINHERFQNLQGKTSLSESMAILKEAKICIGNDSGMNHIAEAYGVPCVTIFGPTDPRFGFKPHGALSRTISRELWCKPCSTTGKKECFRDRQYCMEEITVTEVKDTSLEVLRSL
jgi:ADP-heptose:LPS heptosyltransferase